MISPPLPTKKIRTNNTPILTEAFKGFDFFNTESVSKYDVEDPEFNLVDRDITYPIIPLTNEDEDTLSQISSKYNAKLQ